MAAKSTNRVNMADGGNRLSPIACLACLAGFAAIGGLTGSYLRASVFIASHAPRAARREAARSTMGWG